MTPVLKAVRDGTIEGQKARYALMLLIRGFWERCKDLHDRGEIRGSVHLGAGQEAVAVGVCSALEKDDTIVTTYRGHGHTIAKGTPIREVLAEMCGRVTGCCRGLGGSVHLADARVGNLGANAIVGAGVPIAVGAALAHRLSGSGRVAVVFFGDGAINQGVVMESLNLAAVWKLPVLFACENNQFAEMTSASAMIATKTIAERAAGIGLVAQRSDGMDVEAARNLAISTVAALRQGEGPMFIEFETYRFSGHYHGDPETIRTLEQIEAWRPRDPVRLSRMALGTAGTSQAEFAMIEAEVEKELDEAESFALESPRPSESVLHSLVPPAIRTKPKE